MAIRRFAETDHTRLWDHLNRLAADAEDEAAAQLAKTRIAGGMITISVTTNQSTSQRVDFPAGKFTNSPIVQATKFGTTGREHHWDVKFASLGPTGCTIWLVPISATGSDGPITISWLAIETV